VDRSSSVLPVADIEESCVHEELGRAMEGGGLPREAAVQFLDPSIPLEPLLAADRKSVV